MPKAPRAKLVNAELKQMHKNFCKFIKQETGYEPDEKTVHLATLLRMDFQRSDINQAELALRRDAAAQRVADREKNREQQAARKEERAAAAAAKKAAKPVKAAKADKTTKVAPTKKASAKKILPKKAGKPKPLAAVPDPF